MVLHLLIGIGLLFLAVMAVMGYACMVAAGRADRSLEAMQIRALLASEDEEELA